MNGLGPKAGRPLDHGSVLCHLHREHVCACARVHVCVCTCTCAWVHVHVHVFVSCASVSVRANLVIGDPMSCPQNWITMLSPRLRARCCRCGVANLNFFPAAAVLTGFRDVRLSQFSLSSQTFSRSLCK